MKTDHRGILYLVPALLGDCDPSDVLPEGTLKIFRGLKVFIAENAKSARQLMKKAGMNFPMSEIKVLEIDKHDSKIDFDHFFEELRQGNDTGILSEAGMPAIADPGSRFVLQAHREKIRVVPLTGPSSIFLALAASGMNGQGFTFHGYLPKEKNSRMAALRNLESDARRSMKTQIFIETPYRNQQLIEDILTVCSDNTLLCVASDISLPGESIRTLPVSQWKKENRFPDRKPSVFLLL